MNRFIALFCAAAFLTAAAPQTIAPLDATEIQFSYEKLRADFYRKTLGMVDRIPTLRGMSPWILKDFRSPRRQNPEFQQGWNRKGLISETGQRKQAFDVLANYYAAKAGTVAR